VIDESLMRPEERAAFMLQALYRRCGYLPFRMSRFEEYDFYARNKDFLVSDRIITFTDSRGRLLALKPDVTLSIIKSGADQPGCKQKLCYSEKVFRAAGSMGEFKEITQAGLECIGDLDAYDSFEVAALAVRSLSLLGADYVLNLSHLGLLNALLAALGEDGALARQAAQCIAGRNVHELEALCRAARLPEDTVREFCFFAGLHAPLSQALEELAPYCESEAALGALSELRGLSGMLEEAGISDKVFFDFTVVNNRKYYNGLVFQGFLAEVPESVLAGGQYDGLMARMGRRASGLGFAVYLDRLPVRTDAGGADVDVLLLYSDPAAVPAAVKRLQEKGKSVSAQREIPAKLRYRELVDLRGGAENA
jgi:ATP phosphoribosyltransferase regulatory subunit